MDPLNLFEKKKTLALLSMGGNSTPNLLYVPQRNEPRLG